MAWCLLVVSFMFSAQRCFTVATASLLHQSTFGRGLSDGGLQGSQTTDAYKASEVPYSVYQSADTGGSTWRERLEMEVPAETDGKVMSQAMALAAMRRQEVQLAVKDEHQRMADRARLGLVRNEKPSPDEHVDDLVRTQWWGHFDRLRRQSSNVQADATFQYGVKHSHGGASTDDHGKASGTAESNVDHAGATDDDSHYRDLIGADDYGDAQKSKESSLQQSRDDVIMGSVDNSQSVDNRESRANAQMHDAFSSVQHAGEHSWNDENNPSNNESQSNDGDSDGNSSFFDDSDGKSTLFDYTNDDNLARSSFLVVHQRSTQRPAPQDNIFPYEEGIAIFRPNSTPSSLLVSHGHYSQPAAPTDNTDPATDGDSSADGDPDSMGVPNMTSTTFKPPATSEKKPVDVINPEDNTNVEEADNNTNPDFAEPTSTDEDGGDDEDSDEIGDT